MTQLVRFGSGGRVYTFPDYQQSYHDNFSNLVPRTIRLPGMSGGFDEYGDEAAPQEIGTITLRTIIKAPTRSAMTEKLDEVKQVATWGRRRLYMRPNNAALPERFCVARINSIQLAERNAEHTDLHQPVTFTFQVSNPRWQAGGTEAWIWGDGTAWGSAIWGGGGSTPVLTASGVTNYTIHTGGTAITYPRISIVCGAGKYVINPRIQRLEGAAVVDEIAWTGTVNADQTLEINCRDLSVKLNGIDAYDGFSALHPAWLRLLPGDNPLRFSGDTAAAGIEIYTRYYEVYL